MKKFILILFFIFTSVNILFAQSDPAAKSQWLTQTDTAYNFSFQYPVGWQLKLPNTNTRFFVTSYTENDEDNFRENINCMVRKMEQPDFKIISAEEAIINSLKTKLSDFNLIKSGYAKWNNVDALQLDYTATQKNGEVTYNLHLFQQMAVVNGQLFTLTFTSEKNSYTKYFETISKIIESIKVKK
jgi:hypothetical protein